MSDAASCACGAGPKLIFACSGAADVGAVADQAARKLSAQGAGKMYCLAGVGGRVSGIVETTKAASRILVIDGCPLDCARNTMEQAGFNRYDFIRLSDLGMEKGKTAVAEETIAKVAALGAEKLAG
ncbi:MAG: putative zinc-binding protein [Candidatus Sumerlaeota bacterium]|nr:putative zinc-binding protein [Candidatus Sumerlaeota bacterium]